MLAYIPAPWILWVLCHGQTCQNMVYFPGAMEDDGGPWTYGNQLSLEVPLILQCFFWQHVSPFQVLVSSCIILYHLVSSCIILYHLVSLKLQLTKMNQVSWFGPSTVYQDPTATVSYGIKIAFRLQVFCQLLSPAAVWKPRCAAFFEGWRVWNHWMLQQRVDAKPKRRPGVWKLRYNCIY